MYTGCIQLHYEKDIYIYTYLTILIRYIMNIVQLYIEICGANLFIYLFVNPSSSPVEKVRGHQK